MALKLKPIHHFRSKSSPIKPHPHFSQFNELLYKLEALQVQGVSFSQPLLSYKLQVLVHLHTNLCQMTCNHPYGLKGHDEKLFEFLLDASIWLIDACGTIRDLLMHTREETQRLLSAMRRKLNKHGVSRDVSLCFNSRKVVKSIIVRLLKAMERFEKKFTRTTNQCNPINIGSMEGKMYAAIPLFSKNKETVFKRFTTRIGNEEESNSLLHILRKSQLISVDVLKSMLYYVAGSRTLLHAYKWPLFSKMIHFKQEPSEEEVCFKRNKFEVVDISLCMLVRPKTASCIKNAQIENLRNHLEDLVLLVLDLERSTECLYRVLIKSRVLLLNILNN